MPPPNPDEMLLLIRCPSCGQRFKALEALRGRMAECGGCENRFRINDEVIVRSGKHYPGERKDPILHRFKRVPMALPRESLAVPVAQYEETPSFESFEPTSPLRVIAGLVAVAAMACIALLLMFGNNRGGALDGMTTKNRLVIAGFTGLLGIVLLIYANPRSRVKALVIGLLLGVGVVSVPFYFNTGEPLSNGNESRNVAQQTPQAPEVKPSGKVTQKQQEATKDDELRKLIGTGPLEDEIARLDRDDSDRVAVGLWLRNLRESNRFLVRDYILRTTQADSQSHFFPRGGGDFLMVVTGIKQSLDEVSVIASALGTIGKVYPSLSVVEVQIDNDDFISAPIEKLADKTKPEFYDLNKHDLESIDLERVSNAVKRLASAEPKVYRTDITRKLISLLGQDWVTFKSEVCNALAVWAENPSAAGEIALKEVRKLMVQDKVVPVEMIALIVKAKNPAVVPVLDELWLHNATHWESLYGDVGAAAESTLIRGFPATDITQRHSAVRLLGRVGGQNSLPVLEAAENGADSELKVLIRNARTSIRERAGL